MRLQVGGDTIYIRDTENFLIVARRNLEHAELKEAVCEAAMREHAAMVGHFTLLDAACDALAKWREENQ
jgi:hypothetical protein